jgi:L-rhamnose mutarotase
MKRLGQIIGVDPQSFERCKEYNAAIWHEILEMITACNITNYSNFHKDSMLFASFEYAGDDFAGDMVKMASHPKTQEWWSVMVPMQRPVENRSKGVL